MSLRVTLVLGTVLLAGAGVSSTQTSTPPAARTTAPAATTTSYDALVKIYQDLRASQQPAVTAGVPDYTAAAVQARRARLDEIGKVLDGVDSSAWPIPRKVDHLLTLALWRDYDFQHRVMRAWARDPGFYASQVERVPMTQLPVSGDALAQLELRLAAVPRLLDQARANLTEGGSEQNEGTRSAHSRKPTASGTVTRTARHPRPARSGGSTTCSRRPARSRRRSSPPSRPPAPRLSPSATGSRPTARS